MNHIPGYPKVYNLGHPAVAELLNGNVVAQEKYDGSQFSFANFDGHLIMRSRGADIYPETSDKLFKPAVETAARLFASGGLVPAWIYRCECISKPKHNTVAYDRTPKGSLILFDIEMTPYMFMDPRAVASLATRLGLESACLFYSGLGANLSITNISAWLDCTSTLGGAKIEGVVIKNYTRFGVDGKTLMGKHVSEEFKETHKGEWKKSNPGGKDILGIIVGILRTPARWQKAVQHLRDAGQLQNAPQDIGPLLKELSKDLKEECVDEIKEILFDWAWKHIARGVGYGLPEWYKKRLLASQPGLAPADGVPVEPQPPMPEFGE